MCYNGYSDRYEISKSHFSPRYIFLKDIQRGVFFCSKI
uniref:Uncharacterized protein n=1 Tax=Siphoviridae sp. ctM4P7 TaxID=2826256 RepID=A0A8S5MXT3_9CAUD|nr:MAG TPA: hypothetical protein [Siphoviridae sp. ctM4P7]